MVKLNIVFAFDDGYAQHAGIAIKSMLINCSKPKDLKIFILDGGISENNKNNLRTITKQHSTLIEFIKVHQLLKKKDFLTMGHFGIMAYARYFIPELISQVKSVIYLDSDIIVLGDILELKKYCCSDAPISAVFEGKVSKGGFINLNEGEGCFNSGVLVINSDLWRKKRLTDTLVKFTQHWGNSLKYADQDVLNDVFKGKWSNLPDEWNVTLDASFKRFSLDRKSLCLKDYYKNAKLIHFASPLKPWYFKSNHPLKNIYLDYLKKTPWKSYSYPDLNIKSYFLKSYYYFYSFPGVNTIRRIFLWIRNIFSRLY